MSVRNIDESDALGVRKLFGSNVRELRQELGLTQQGLSDELRRLKVHLTQTMIAKLERGDRPTTVEEATVLALVLEVPIQTLFQRDSLSRLESEVDLALMELLDGVEQLAHAVAVYYQRQAALIGSRERLNVMANEAGVQVKEHRVMKDSAVYAGLDHNEVLERLHQRRTAEAQILERALRGDFPDSPPRVEKY
ncbi:helix-turn-helix transcriptional regulator [Arthrobacter sp. CJ23]|uniref:helix-turn-helix transcriptional regulator n=1 Tax=Arthrobacter sp. CJ23 TaxID=2972479 RepID=UPI00215D4C8F|nr:helix-turn-helix transcriptional regulator [Arthrobacter sp. CJ23]UVJ40251.1 helix-turn-helix domain-containing protein [Arthrobacter sp. CJ23]